MSMTDRQKATIQEVLRQKGFGPSCPMCRNTSWQLHDDLVHSPVTVLGAAIMQVGGPVIPMAQLICTNCGFVSHHAVGALGIKLE